MQDDAASRRPRGRLPLPGDRAHRLAPRYELWLVGGDTGEEPVLVWTRHRFRALAELSLREERKHLRLRPARLVVHDRRSPAG
ncbi:hypothetical protein E9529_08715 [Blastococcus sp. KM273128]|uniref:hypothetical protein n=1 Tax=Blastococcus sp. KM273128 TaxID=2570314 RepID=UPI001F31F8CA|nr:hypothetical protein [Blastococcus sp. KM273128]MCF6744355.1 hypothetical protein [Blastococcus sp. KM273128]